MPFQSQFQLRQCVISMMNSLANGKKSDWDCDEWLQETPKAPFLHQHVADRDTKGKYVISNPPSIPKKHRRITGVFEGPRGGDYLLAGGVRISIPKNLRSWALKHYGKATEEDWTMAEEIEELIEKSHLDSKHNVLPKASFRSHKKATSSSSIKKKKGSSTTKKYSSSASAKKKNRNKK